jgi:hypothetical protein
MKTSSDRFKSIAVTAGLSFWFFIITSSIGIFSIEILIIFVAVILSFTQIFAKKISKGLDVFAIINTKIFLGILFAAVIVLYGILFRLLKIDLLRLNKQKESYWIKIEEDDLQSSIKQY